MRKSCIVCCKNTSYSELLRECVSLFKSFFGRVKLGIARRVRADSSDDDSFH
jgi:hypothetical protein